MTNEEIKKTCLEIAQKNFANSGTAANANDLVKEATILYDYIKKS